MFVSILAIIVVAVVQRISSDECPQIVTQAPFDVDKYLGVWYEAYRNENPFELGFKCVNATYKKNSDGSVAVLNQAENGFGKYQSISGTARVKNMSEPAAFELIFPPPVPPGQYNVIASNYVEYSLIYSCSLLPIFKSKYETIFLLSRQKTLSPTAYNELITILKKMGATVAGIKATVQDC